MPDNQFYLLRTQYVSENVTNDCRFVKIALENDLHFWQKFAQHQNADHITTNNHSHL